MAFSKVLKSHAGFKSAKDRISQFPGEFYVDSNILMCYACEKAVEHNRKSTIVDHIRSNKHQLQKQKRANDAATAAAIGSTSSEPAAKKLRQATIFHAAKTAETAKESREEVATDFLKAMLAANIPLAKADNPSIREFLVKHVRNGGSIAGSRTLREKIPSVYDSQREILKSFFADSPVSVITDETTDDRAKLVLNILLSVPVQSEKDPMKAYLIDTVILDRVTARTVGGAVIRCLSQFGVEFEKVTGFITDGARYMKACFRDVIQPLCENCVHVVCIAHSINLIGEILRKETPQVDLFVANMKTAFRLSSAKRRAYSEHLLEAGIENPKAPPAPVITRWYSWLEAVAQHSNYFSYYQDMLVSIREEFGETAGVGYLVEMLSDSNQRCELDAVMRCLSEIGLEIIKAIKVAESQTVAAHKAYNHVMQLSGCLRAAALNHWLPVLGSSGLKGGAARRVEQSIERAVTEAANKADLFLGSKEISWQFLRAVRVFDPNQLLTMSGEISQYSAIPGLKDTPTIVAEWLIYRRVSIIKLSYLFL
jgi:hypothetical protein